MATTNQTSQTLNRRILFIDAYDSFSNNIVALLETALDVNVDIVRIDLSSPHIDGKIDQKASIAAVCQSYDAIVCGPGPGTPLNPKDVGLFNFVWELSPAIPVLGICLGFQSLVATHGGNIRRLKRGLHGMVREIEHQDVVPNIFAGVPSFTATLYHSLCADIGQDEFTPEAWKTMDKWTPMPSCPDLIPIAWTTERREDGVEERILMGVKHTKKPFWGLQYHPESVCTDPTAHAVLRNWFQCALESNSKSFRRRRNSYVIAQDTLSREPTVHPHNQLASMHEFLKTPKSDKWWNSDGSTDEDSDIPTENSDTPTADSDLLTGDPESILKSHLQHYVYISRKLSVPKGVGVPELVEILGLGSDESIILDSSSSKNGDPLAQYSIVAVDVERALRVEHHVTDDFVTFTLPMTKDHPEISHRVALKHPERDLSAWEVISHFWHQRMQPADPKSPYIPFRGGFMGFITYEMGLHGLDPKMVPAGRDHKRPDIALAWISKSVVIDHRAGVAYVQSLATGELDDSWVDVTANTIKTDPLWTERSGNSSFEKNQKSTKDDKTTASANAQPERSSSEVRTLVPSADVYEEKVRICQDEIAAGQSYELCLTDQTKMTRPQRSSSKSEDGSPWKMYQTLRTRQPAPFGSFIRLSGATLLSCSPERFLSHDAQGLCSMRPMKGTVRKSEAVSTLAQAEAILHVPKEEAENLMIVDLVRHDLHGICGAEHVTVPDLMKVEEYATVFQMITVVNGQLPYHETLPYTGFDALAVSLPPGSMTGAPKKRSCEILQRIERQERSLYSGVVGFMDISGGGDWSVTIRSIFHWDDWKVKIDGEGKPHEQWRIGAGGAVTILSTPEGEREEMFIKLAGPLGVFRDTA